MSTTEDTKTAPIIVTLGGVEYVAELPDYETRYELWFASGNNKIRGYAAMLGLCLPELMRPSVNYARFNYNAFTYGQAVWEALRNRGIDPEVFVPAAAPIAAAISTGLFPSAEVEKQAVFTHPTEGEQTS